MSHSGCPGLILPMELGLGPDPCPPSQPAAQSPGREAQLVCPGEWNRHPHSLSGPKDAQLLSDLLAGGHTGFPAHRSRSGRALRLSAGGGSLAPGSPSLGPRHRAS